jgi:arsenate reductase-like glutaredoxin family protein
MGANVVLWVRAGQAESEDALRFLKANRYAADKVLDLRSEPPRAADLDRLAKGMGGLWPLVDPKGPDLPRLLPKGDATPPELLRDLLCTTPGLLRSPILLTPKGAVAGFREQKWRVFLDIGRGRA